MLKKKIIKKIMIMILYKKNLMYIINKIITTKNNSYKVIKLNKVIIYMTII